MNDGNHGPSNPPTLLLRHTLATLAYRGAKVVASVPDGFADFRASPTTRSAGEILAHTGDLLDWALRVARGERVYKESAAVSWADGRARFFASLKSLDDHLTSGAPLGCSSESIFQGPIADALTHIGQIAMLRRMAGSPVRGENYFLADIGAGRVGPDQSTPRREFD